jgi:hypothetical protein
LIAAVTGAIVGVGRLGGQVTTMGWVALAAGTVVSLALAAGLMALMFHSARSGYDDRAAADPAAPDLSDGDAD